VTFDPLASDFSFQLSRFQLLIWSHVLKVNKDVRFKQPKEVRAAFDFIVISTFCFPDFSF